MKPTNQILLFLFAVLLLAQCNSCSRMDGFPDSTVLETLDNPEAPNSDSVTVITTTRYDAGPIKRIFQGWNYRKAWSTPISVPVIALSTYKGGLLPIKKGGGKQTLSMDLQGANGVVYTLRSVTKNPESLIPNYAKRLKIEDLAMDAISAQHPYGAVIAAALADAVEIPHTKPQIVYLPAQEELGEFNEEFKNRLYLLEYEPEGSAAWSDMDNVVGLVDTEDVEIELEKNPNAKIDADALVRVRLFDLMIGDWDRHAKQWGWFAIEEKNNQVTFVPLPTDRDNAFYNPNGVVPWILTRPYIISNLRPFRKQVDHMPSMIKPFDRVFLLDIPLSKFEAIAAQLKENLTDEEIDKAFRSLPTAFLNKDTDKMKKRLKARRENLVSIARSFKKCIDKQGEVKKPLKGSNRVFVGK
ncbi:MAG: hypothetical protein AB8F74_10440 [Saprospiraceae bacterium]